MPNNNGGLLRDQAGVYYVMRFGGYYTGDRGIRGRIIELATIKGDGSYTYENGYVLGEMRESAVFLFTDQEVSILVNSLNVYNHHVDDSFVNFPFNALPEGDNDEIAGNPYFDGKIKEASDNVYFALDPNWNNNDSDSSTPRVQIAHGQSDITRHESYFKKEMSPNYKFQDMPKEIIDLMKFLGVEQPEDISFGLADDGSLAIILSDPDSVTLVVIANQYEYNEMSQVEYIKSYHYILDDRNKNELLNYSKATISDDWEPLIHYSYFILSSEAMKYLDGKATVLGGQK